MKIYYDGVYHMMLEEGETSFHVNTDNPVKAKEYTLKMVADMFNRSINEHISNKTEEEIMIENIVKQ
jgi:hypothetical protein